MLSGNNVEDKWHHDIARYLEDRITKGNDKNVDANDDVDTYKIPWRIVYIRVTGHVFWI